MNSVQEIKKEVRERYGSIARTPGTSCCEPEEGGSSCCGGSVRDELLKRGEQIGYSKEELEAVPEGSNMGLGCGNPTAIASLAKGETVLDLGSGGGFDCFLAAKQVGDSGHVIGVDMTIDMVEKARTNAEQGGYENVEFRLGELEHLPVADNSVDVIISNCVVNLVPDKDQVFREVYRVLKPGGRMMISDIVLNGELPEEVQNDVNAYTGCVAGASLKTDYLEKMRAVGFSNVEIVEERSFGNYESDDPEKQKLIDEVGALVVSANIKAVK